MSPSTPGPSGTLPHLPSLDGLRGVAILLVLMHQLNRVGGGSLPNRLLEHGLDFGWVGVQLFFVLSGFLITGILLETRDSPGYFRSFFTRRVLRIFPLYYGALVLFLGIFPALGIVPSSWREHQSWLWLYLSNWTTPYVGSPLPHFWSLAIEEQFYLLWPFVVLRLGAAPLLRLCLAIAASGLAARTGMVAAGVLPEAIYMSSISRMDALALGAAAAALARLPGAPVWSARQATLWKAAWVLGLAGFALTRAYPRTSPLGQTLGYSILAVVFALAILALARADATRAAGPWIAALRSAPLRALGRYSYGMYVFHKPLHDLVGKPALKALGLGDALGPVAGLAYVAAGTLATLAAGMASWWLFERHFLGLKERLAPRKARSALPRAAE